MPPYVISPIGKNVKQAVPGTPAYLLGSYNDGTSPTKMRISTVKLTSPTAQVTGTVIEGNTPTVGQLVSIAGAVPAYFNVSGAKITAVSAPATPDVGVYTISFALTNSNIATTNSPGVAVAPQAEIGDVIVAGASQEVSIQENVNPANGKSIRASVLFPSNLGSATVALQTSVTNVDADYSTLGTVATMTGGTVAGGDVIFANVEALFCRFLITGVAGSGGTVVGKVTV